MAKQQHAAPTSVTVASIQEETLLHRLVQKHWPKAAALAAVIVALILWVEHKKHTAIVSDAESWVDLDRIVQYGGEFNPQTRLPNPSRVVFPEAGALAAMADDLKGTPAAPWAKALEIGRRLRDGDDTGALQAADALRAGWPKHPLVASPLPLGGADEPADNLVDFVQQRLKAVQTWESAHPELFANPSVPEGAPRVRFETNQGNLVFALYEDRAPAHVANFLAQVEAGTFVGTKVHRVIPGQMIFGGDPNSVQGEPETWGLGGVETALPKEASGLYHFPHVLAMDRAPGSLDSSASLFYMTLSPQHGRDGSYTVFGALVEGAHVLDRIAALPLASGRPVDPVTIQAATKLP